ncbi:glycosyltransferase family 2 protein [Candidatus Bipolaricaulota bacterium]
MAKWNDVSVILPVFNGERYLAEAIESALAQTACPQEIIVVDDGSTDDSARIAQEYVGCESNVRYFRQPNRGIGAARNLGIAQARGGYLAFLDADDTWFAEKLSLQRSAFDQNPGVDLVFGHVTQFVSPELSEEQRREIRCPSDPMPGYLATTLLVPQEVFHRVGPFETSLRMGEFLHWYLRAKELHLETIMLPDVVMRRRIHTQNQGRRERNARTDYVHVLKAALDRRRGLTDERREPR